MADPAVQTKITAARSGLLDVFVSDIERAVSDVDIDRAVKCLLEFARELAPVGALINRAILLAATHADLGSRIRIEGVNPTLTGERNRLLISILELKDDVTAVVSKDPRFSPEQNRPPVALVRDPPTAPSPGPATGPAESLLETDLDRARRRFLRAREEQAELSDHLVCRASDLQVAYKRRFRGFELRGVTLDLSVGEITGLVGVNGSGKTTLLEILRGAMAQAGGTLEYPALTRDRSGWAHIRRQIAFVPQHLRPWPGLVVDNLHLRAAYCGLKGARNIEEVEWLLHRFELTEYREARWGDLSGGFKMRFALVLGLLSRPRLLILDEPLAHLDILAQQQFLSDLKSVSRSANRPMPIVISSQHLFEVESIADQVIFLNNGSVVYQGTLSDLEANRRANFVELATDRSIDEITRVLGVVPGARVESAGLYTLVTLPLDFSTEAVIQKLMEGGVRVRYFRDISGSTVNLFRTRIARRDP